MSNPAPDPDDEPVVFGLDDPLDADAYIGERLPDTDDDAEDE